MGKKPLWESQSSGQLASFAEGWIQELDNPSGPDEFGQAVVWMGFTAPFEQQWEFLRAVLGLADTDDHLRHIAAGPAEQILSKFGEECIELCEIEAQSNPQFARMLTGVWQHLMPDSVWRRVQSIQAGVNDPLVMGDGPA